MDELLNNLREGAIQLAPFVVLVAIMIAVLWLTDFLLKKNRRLGHSEGRFSHQTTMLIITGLAVLLCLLALPVTDETRKNLLSVFGLVVTAMITLGSTTFASNAMAGLMLRSMNKFRPGDFLKIEDHFGRVTERGLFHTEIQTEDRDLTTIPNMFLVQRPTTVVHETGTMISSTVSLGYDVPVDSIETALIQAGTEAGLEDPFVRVNELGDFSVTYRLTGFLKEIKTMVGTRSRLRRCMLNTLHAAGIEIVSPNVMIQRPMPPSEKIMPQATEPSTAPDQPATPTSETRMFEKAEKAGRLEELRQRHEGMKKKVRELKEQLSKATEEEKPAIEAEMTSLSKRIDSLESAWETIESRLNEKFES